MRSATQKIIELSAGSKPSPVKGKSYEQLYLEARKEVQKSRAALLEQQKDTKNAELVKTLRKEMTKLYKKVARLQQQKNRTVTNVTVKEKIIDEFLRTKRYTSVQRKALLSRKQGKKTNEFGDEDCLRAAVIKSVSDQALNLLRATEPFPIPSGR